MEVLEEQSTSPCERRSEQSRPCALEILRIERQIAEKGSCVIERHDDRDESAQQVYRVDAARAQAHSLIAPGIQTCRLVTPCA
jgi:hypothetical protein